MIRLDERVRNTYLQALFAQARTAHLERGTNVMRLHEIMRSPVVTVDAGVAATDAWSLMKQRRIRHLIVTEGAQLVGVVSERDIDRGGGSGRDKCLVSEVMTPSIVTAGANSTLRHAAKLMWGRRIGSLPVLDGERLVGIVTATDVLEALGRGSSRPKIRAERYTLRLPAGSKQLGGRPVVRRHPRASASPRRGRPRKPGSKKRAPLPGWIPKELKRQPGATGATGVVAHIRSLGNELDHDDQAYIRRKLGMKLGKFASSIERISVRVEDANGPRGGIDQVCRIKVVLSGVPSVVFEKRDASLEAAIDGAIAGTERAVRRSLKRKRMKSIKAAARRSTPRLPDLPEELGHVAQMVPKASHGGAQRQQHRA
jgi:CBS domain-containing protein/ribosome-associated translation inhibitor RaiA